MTTLLQKAFLEVQKLPDYLQDELAQQLLNDIENELKWQTTLSQPNIELGTLMEMAEEALTEEELGETESNGFGES